MNGKFSSGFRKRQNEICSELLNHAGVIVENIINKMKQVSPAMIESLQIMPTVLQIFLVRRDSMNVTEMKTIV